MKVLISLPDEKVKKLKDVCEKEKRTQSAVIELALDIYFKNG